MKTRSFVAAALAATLALSALPSFAQHNDRRGNNREEIIQKHQRQADRRDDRRGDRWDRRDDRFDRRDDRRNARNHYYRGGHRYYYSARGPEFRRGRYIPREYRNRQYVVVNHRVHHLYAPPRGHQWVQVGTDYVLIAVATGLIAHIVLNH
ncbi:MAG: hypothetical protein A3E51_13110 [Burkholderiales bacterium RIFCSPHIGHO2_12_FULL_67_38]|nr:MAG: hypothetical protein A3I64_20755 [Burkholderiales bacterium RIFCSPLOWO2_02_FULL_67_64]OGB36086.1 MAG: hypothetical protein A3E51_13110 [Burkholderiales bacterium RIFCSPHIGHO2_12_FULL_67_38]OGB80525.1 MAG: hypothetical protein A3G82_24375 [Burkholderiales bacterium RIFCSPLOWO2_12_FULL_67_210]